jgi:hypothetical protein
MSFPPIGIEFLCSDVFVGSPNLALLSRLRNPEFRGPNMCVE